MAVELTKRPTESLLYTMTFSPLLATGETVSSVTSFVADTPTGADALTVATITSSTTAAQARISGGTHGVTYHVTVTVLTSDSNTRVGCGKLTVLNC